MEILKLQTDRMQKDCLKIIIYGAVSTVKSFKTLTFTYVGSYFFPALVFVYLKKWREKDIPR